MVIKTALELTLNPRQLWILSDGTCALHAKSQILPFVISFYQILISFKNLLKSTFISHNLPY